MILAAILVVAMTATTFTTQRQLMSKNMPADAMSGQYAQQQKMLLYVLPVVFAVGGVAFPIGVLFYWTTTNLWTMGQQFYVIRSNPAPGTPAFKAKQKRDRAKGRGVDEPAAATPRTVDRGRREPPRQQPRQQPKKQPSSSASGSGGAKPARQRPQTMTTARPRGRPHERDRADRADRADRRPSDARSRRRGREAAEARGRRRVTSRRRRRCRRLEREGDIAADYLEELLDIADLDGDIDMDVEGERAAGVDRRRRPRSSWSASTARCSTRCRS